MVQGLPCRELAVGKVHAVQAKAKVAAGGTAIVCGKRLLHQRASTEDCGERGQAAVSSSFEPCEVVRDACVGWRRDIAGCARRSAGGKCQAGVRLVVMGSPRQGGWQPLARRRTGMPGDAQARNSPQTIVAAPSQIVLLTCRHAQRRHQRTPHCPAALTHAAEPAQVQPPARAHQLHRRRQLLLAVRRPVGCHKVQQQVCGRGGGRGGSWWRRPSTGGPAHQDH